MKLRKLLPCIFTICLLISTLSITPVDTYARSSRSKAKTTQTSRSSKKSKSSSSSSRKSRSKKKKKATTRNRSSKKRTTKRSSSVARVQPPEPVSYDSLTLRINSAVLKWVPDNMNTGGLRVNKVTPDSRHRHAHVGLNEQFTYMPLNREFIDGLEKTVKKALPDSISDYRVSLNVGSKPLTYYISTIDKLPKEYRRNIPFVYPSEPYVNPTKGMEGDIVALWHSHGRYFKDGSWAWQRGFLFETIEDVYTMGYVLPFIVPMLENAGAYVMLPRERDINVNEVIVDNDTNDGGELYSQPYYKEKTGSRKWETGEFDGFIYDLKDFRDTENPFEVGTYRQTTTIRSGTPSIAAWYADIPQDGEYAVYVSYKTLPNSTEDAHYTVNYSGGSREFKVNQTMGGSTWIYLGTFPLRAGYDDQVPVVTLTNRSDKAADKVLTADAVKIGGGMGNIARSSRRSDIYYDPSTPVNDLQKSNPSYDDEEALDEDEEEGDEDDEADDESDEEGDDEEDDEENPDDEAVADEETPSRPASNYKPHFSTSGLPRYLEGARYWLHWAGVPESVYSPFHGANDYKDDYTCRGNWVNYLAGGSRVLPNRKGLNIPVDVAVALHTDAGKRSDDTTVGTLGIYYTDGGKNYADGTPRINSRILTDMLMRQIVGDIRKTYEPNWLRRSMWDKPYLEAKAEEVPSSLIELLSHQNFRDMQYGLDPAFRFTVGRAMYKGIARFVAERKDRGEVVIQPLPVKDFAIVPRGKKHYRLEWVPQPDPLEPTAMPSKYIIFERAGSSLGFRKIGETSSEHFDVKVNDTEIHSFRIVAANDGGLSFPSETLSLRDGGDSKPVVLIVNGFDRVSGPAHFTDGGNAGFKSGDDFGVPYIRDIIYSGPQTEFRRGAGEAFGRSSSQYVSKVIAGNTFDYPLTHGAAIANAGYGFVSCSAGAVESGKVNMRNFKVVDLILGKQKKTVVGNGKSGTRFTAFPAKLRQDVTDYLKHGGSLLVTGQYVASDLLGPKSTEDEQRFATDVLGIEMGEPTSKSRSGKLRTIPTDMDAPINENTYSYCNTLNDKQYIVEQPDVFRPSGHGDSQVFAELADTSDAIGTLHRNGNSRSVVLSVPFESLTDASARNRFMKEILNFLSR